RHDLKFEVVSYAGIGAQRLGLVVNVLSFIDANAFGQRLPHVLVRRNEVRTRLLVFEQGELIEPVAGPRPRAFLDLTSDELHHYPLLLDCEPWRPRRKPTSTATSMTSASATVPITVSIKTLVITVFRP